MSNLSLSEIEDRTAALEADPLTGRVEDAGCYGSREEEVRGKAADLAVWVRRRCWSQSVRPVVADLLARLDRVAGFRVPRFDVVCSGGIIVPAIW